MSGSEPVPARRGGGAAQPPARRRLVAGCMTGTSIDSLDAALVEIEGSGLEMVAKFRRGLSRSLGGLGTRLRALADQRPMSAGEIAGLSRDFSLLHAEAVGELAAGERLDLVCVHGQTVYHAPPVSWQLLTPAAIARALGAPVVFDLRAADLAAGGQGAPITPIADWVLFRHVPVSAGFGLAVVNLGGFCNFTRIPAQRPGGRSAAERMVETLEATARASPARAAELEGMISSIRARSPIEAIKGGDVCPCNHLLDGIARTLFGVPYDEGGTRSLAGSVHEEARDDLEGVIAALQAKRRSLGTGDELLEWISRWRGRTSPENLGATACDAIAQAIARATALESTLLLAGGGAKNMALRKAIEYSCAATVHTTDDFGVPAVFREAICFAVLGALCQDRVPITLPAVTGVAAPAPVAGVWVYP